MDRTQFNEALVSLIEFASANANHVSKKDIELHFKDILKDESMYNAIYSYLKESKISIDDIADDEIAIFSEDVSSDNKFTDDSSVSASQISSSREVIESEEELEFLEMYKDDIANLIPLSSEEKEKLITDMQNGDSLAMAKLTEDYLNLVRDIAAKFKGKGLTLGDLIQEGNIGLMLALPEFDRAPADLDNYLENKITSSIEEAISTQISSERISSHLADRMNSLDTLSRDLTEKLGHAPSVKELAEEMNISEDEVDTIIRTSLNVLSVEQSEE